MTGLQSYNTSPASGSSVSFNEETSPHYAQAERHRVGRFCSVILKFVALTVNQYFVRVKKKNNNTTIQGQHELQGPQASTNPDAGIRRIKYTLNC